MPYASPVPVPAGATEPAALTALYVTTLIGGLLVAGLIYLLMFDEFSESELVSITPLWFFPVVFGLYGFASQRLLRHIATGAREPSARRPGSPSTWPVTGRPWCSSPFLVLN
ncbi:hypothetical protein [Streptomyces europaeiscabiei]|uniref:hypothetical protein n=1 Tax=Streptomyces europaeiscabiei TaxID=146819 RepID=UPI002E19DB16